LSDTSDGVNCCGWDVGVLCAIKLSRFRVVSHVAAQDNYFVSYESPHSPNEKMQFFWRWSWHSNVYTTVSRASSCWPIVLFSLSLPLPLDLATVPLVQRWGRESF